MEKTNGTSIAELSRSKTQRPQDQVASDWMVPNHAHPRDRAQQLTGFATHKTKQLRPVKSGGAELMIRQINSAVARFKEAMLEHDKAMKAMRSAPWAFQLANAVGFEGVPEKPDMEIYAKELVSLGVDLGSAYKYLRNALKSKR